MKVEPLLRIVRGAGQLPRRLPPHHDEMYAEEPRDGVDQRVRAPEVGRIRSRLDTSEAEAFVVALELAPAGQMEDHACFASEERLDHCGPDVLPLLLREDGDRGQFAASVAMRLDLAHADHLSVLLGNHEIWPLKVHSRQTYLRNEASDCRLVVFGRGTDGERHPDASRLSPGSANPAKRMPHAPNTFVHLHNHTEYSLLDGASRIHPLVEAAAKLEMPALAITDHGVMYGAIHFYKACKEFGIKPIVGCEVYVAPRSRLMREGRVENDMDGAKESVAAFRDIFTKDRFLLEVQRHGIDKQDRVNEALVGFGKEFGLRLCATNDLHYVHKHDSESHDVLLCLQTGARFNDPNRWRFSTQENYLKTPDEMAERFADLPEALASTLEVADMVDLKINLGATLLPPFDVPDGLTPDQYLTKLVADGLNWRYNGDPSTAVKERAESELAVIKATGYASYFLIVWDFYKYARSHEIVVGPGRGSAAGSLVSYCLGITNLDPIQHGLIFERFLNIDRVSMPDIDCDFSVEGREKVIRYVSEKYGSDRVAQIITFTTMASKAAIRDVGRVLEVPLRDTDRLAKLIPVWQGRSKSLDDAVKEVPEFREAYESNEEQKRMIDVARTLEGVSRNVSTHAAGVVVAPEPLVRYTPLQFGPGREAVVTQYDMKAVGDIGLLKIDFLGLQNLDIIATCRRLVREHRGIEIDLEHLPLDDAKTFELIANGDTHGVFQFEGAGMRRMLMDMRPQSFGDVSAAVALFRPGPMVNIPAFVARKQGREPIEYMHERLEPILRETYGVMIYQEQVMMAARELAGFTMSEADILRAAMGKKDKPKMAKQRTKFVAGAR